MVAQTVPRVSRAPALRAGAGALVGLGVVVGVVLLGRVVAGPAPQHSLPVVLAAMGSAAVLAARARSLAPAWRTWRSGLLLLAGVVAAQPALWALAAVTSELAPHTPLAWATAVVAGVGHLPLIAAFSMLPVAALGYLGRGARRWPLAAVVALGSAALLAFALFFDDFAPLRADALVASTRGATVGMLLNAAFLSTVLLGPGVALWSAWRAEEPASRRTALVAGSSLLGSALVMVCGALGDLPGAPAIQIVLVLMSLAVAAVALGCTHALTAPGSVPRSVPAEEPGAAPDAAEIEAAAPAYASCADGCLTTREAEVLGLLAQGLSNAGIAARLTLSQRTIDAHLRSVFLKLGLPEGPAENRRVHAALAWREPAGCPCRRG